jgi:hypothetical protein
MFQNTLIFSLILGLAGFTKASLAFHPQLNNKNIPNTLRSTIVQKNDSPQETDNYITLEVENFLFQFRGCQLIQYNVTRCDLVISNKLSKRVLYIKNPTRIIDDAGNELIASGFRLGAVSSKYHVKNELSTNIPIKASITFQGSVSDNIKLLNIGAETHGRGSFNVEFFDFEFKKQ